MAGIYIHIPFCKQACHYCNFHFSTSLKYKNEFLAALLNEIVLRKSDFQEIKVETIYFGGGTPGILSVDEIGRIITAFRVNYSCDSVQEITLEMNPDDVTVDKMVGLQKLGINRISLGVQSFFEEDLSYMNRSHTAEKAAKSIQIIHDHFENYTVDLIYGFPLLTDEKLQDNVGRLVEIGVPHISIYGMTVEPKTALDSFIRKGKEKPMQAKQGARQFKLIMQSLAKQDYEHYEISSYAKKGSRAIHNSNYWAGKPYLGFGPGAHSFQGNKRSWNVANNALYIKSLDQNELHTEHETLSPTDCLNELVLLGLRVKEGLDLKQYQEKSTSDKFKELLHKAEEHIANELLENTGSYLRLTTKGKLFCDGISADLFV